MDTVTLASMDRGGSPRSVAEIVSWTDGCGAVTGENKKSDPLSG